MYFGLVTTKTRLPAFRSLCLTFPLHKSHPLGRTDAFVNKKKFNLVFCSWHLCLDEFTNVIISVMKWYSILTEKFSQSTLFNSTIAATVGIFSAMNVQITRCLYHRLPSQCEFVMPATSCFSEDMKQPELWCPECVHCEKEYTLMVLKYMCQCKDLFVYIAMIIREPAIKVDSNWGPL